MKVFSSLKECLDFKTPHDGTYISNKDKEIEGVVKMEEQTIDKSPIDQEFIDYANQGSQIVHRLKELNKPGLLDVISIASPLFFDSSDTREIRKMVKDIKSASGLGPLIEPLSGYSSWVIECDELFTRKRCRTDPQVKTFLSLNKYLERFMAKKIDLGALILRIEQQVQILRLLASRPVKERKPRKKKDEKKKPETSAKTFPGIHSFLAIGLGWKILLIVIGIILIVLPFLISLTIGYSIPDTMQIIEYISFIVGFILIVATMISLLIADRKVQTQS
jgi:hypothetical protein